MDFRKRLSEYNIKEDLQIKENDDIEELFEYDSVAESVIQDILNKNKNIIMVCQKRYETSVLYKYIKKLINKNDSYEILRDLTENIQFISAQKVIVPEPDIQDTVRIFEQIMKGLESFIFSLNAKSYDNILETIRVLIAINYPQLKEQNINHLIGTSGALIVFFEKNSENKFFVKNIGQIINNSDSVILEEIYEKHNIKEKPDDNSVNEEDKVEIQKKANKYKKLKEKYKSKNTNASYIPIL